MENKYLKSSGEDEWDNDLDNSGLIDEDEVDDDILEEQGDNNY